MADFISQFLQSLQRNERAIAESRQADIEAALKKKQLKMAEQERESEIYSPEQRRMGITDVPGSALSSKDVEQAMAIRNLVERLPAEKAGIVKRMAGEAITEAEKEIKRTTEEDINKSIDEFIKRQEQKGMFRPKETVEQYRKRITAEKEAEKKGRMERAIGSIPSMVEESQKELGGREKLLRLAEQIHRKQAAGSELSDAEQEFIQSQREPEKAEKYMTEAPYTKTRQRIERARGISSLPELLKYTDILSGGEQKQIERGIQAAAASGRSAGKTDDEIMRSYIDDALITNQKDKAAHIGIRDYDVPAASVSIPDIGLVKQIAGKQGYQGVYRKDVNALINTVGQNYNAISGKNLSPIAAFNELARMDESAYKNMVLNYFQRLKEQEYTRKEKEYPGR